MGPHTGLKLNNDGDEVWLLAPDESVSDHVKFPKVKAGISFSEVPTGTGATWCMSDPTPEKENCCRTTDAPKAKSSSSKAKKTSTAKKKSSSVLRARYVTETEVAGESGTLISDVPEGLKSLVVTGGEVASGESSSSSLLVEMSVTVVLGVAGAILFFALRRS